MVSVIASWEGRCKDLALQSELVARVAELAAFTRALTTPDKPIERFVGLLEGPILLEPGLLPGGPEVGADGFGRLPRLGLHGVSFEPYFAFKRYAGHCTIDVIFVRDPAVPALDGRMVRVKRGEDLALYDSETVRAASVYIASPSIHLRYQYEAWLDALMGWTKTFFVEDLRYWRHEERLTSASAAFAPADIEAREAQWLAVQRAFAEETGKYELPQLAKAARGANGLPWAWLADHTLVACHTSRAAASLAPREAQSSLRRAATVAVLKSGFGANLDYLPLSRDGRDLALSSRFRNNKLILDIDVAPSVPPRRIVTVDMRPRPERSAPERRTGQRAPGKTGQR